MMLLVSIYITMGESHSKNFWVIFYLKTKYRNIKYFAQRK